MDESTIYLARIFDFDGTLADTGETNQRAAKAALADCGLKIPLAWVCSAPLENIDALRERLRQDFHAEIGCTDVQFVALARSHWLTHISEIKAIDTVIAAVRRTGGQRAVVSANDGTIVRAALAHLDLSDIFTVIVAREDVTQLKPAPDAYLRATKLLQLPPSQCLAYENTDAGVSAALAAGIDVLDVRDTPWTLRRA